MLQNPSSNSSSVSDASQPEAPKAGPVKSFILNIIKFSVTAGILYYLYDKGLLDFTRVQSVLTTPSVVSVVGIIFIAGIICGIYRWMWLLDGQNLPLKFKEAGQLTMIGVFFNTAIPGAVSGDLVKGFYVVRKQPDGRGRVKAFTTLLLDRLLGLSGLVFVSFFAMVFNLDSILSNPVLKPLCGLISMIWAGVVLFYAFVLWSSPISRWIQKTLPKLPKSGLLIKFFDAVKSYENSKHLVFKGFAISVAIHMSLITAFILLARALGGFDTVPASQFFFLVPFGLLVTAIPIAPAGLGTGHAAFLGLFKLANVDGGADLFTAFVSFQLLMSLIGGVFYLKYRGESGKQNL